MSSPGLNELLELIGPQEAATLEAGNPQCVGGSGDALASLVSEAIATPLGLESIRHVVVAGDHVVVAVTTPVPELAGLVTALKKELLAVVMEDGAEGTVEFLAAAATVARMKAHGQLVAAAVDAGLVIHDPAEPADHALLATGCDDQPLQISRRLFDADVVLVLTGAAGGAASNHQASDVFPQFGSAACQENQRRQKPSHAARDRALVDRQLGVDFEVVVQTRPGGVIAGLLCGLRQPCDAAAEQRMALALDEPAAGNAQAVVATIETPSSGSVWQEFEQALRWADERAGEEAPVVVWSRISQLPDVRHAEHFRHGFDREETGRQNEGDDSLAAILGRRPVYLCSQLGQGEVEDLGLGHVSSIRELRHLLESTGPPLLIRDAHLRGPARTSRSLDGHD